MQRFGAIGLVGSLLTGWAFAQESVDPQAEADAVTKLAEAEAANWELRLTNGSRLARHPESILRWSNPNVGRVYGDVFVWTDRGCAAAAGSIYKWYAPYRAFTVEFKTLGRGTLTGQRKGQTLWEPSEEDVTFQELPGSPAPGATEIERLRQMRMLAAEFHVSLRDTRVEREKGTPQELRLLTKPVFRYRSEDPSVLDGAVFAFVVGTDPEALLVVEVRQADGGPRWEYALARLNNDRIEARRGDEKVWQVDHVEVEKAIRSPYMLMTVPRDE